MHAAIRYISTSWPPSMRALLLPSAISDVGKMTAQLHHVPRIKTSKDCRETIVYSARGRDQGATDIPRLEARNPTHLKCPVLP